jgi:predicted nucleic acid-binding protein
VAGELLLDTGGLISLLDRSQIRHAACVKTFEGWKRPVLTTEAVITEATHLLARQSGGVSTVLRFVIEGGAVVVPGSLDALVRAEELVRRYADLPLDYADATLVVLAEDARTGHILTLDVRDFSTVRWGKNRVFHIHPARG